MFKTTISSALVLFLGVATAGPPEKLSQAEAERRIFQCWKEVTVEQHGEKKAGGFGYCFTAQGGPGWPLQGELTSGGDKRKILIDASSNPMRMDIVFLTEEGNEQFVIPYIFKFDNDKLILVRPDGSTKPYRKDGNYPNRPKSFEATKETKYTKKVLKRCEYLEQDD